MLLFWANAQSWRQEAFSCGIGALSLSGQCPPVLPRREATSSKKTIYSTVIETHQLQSIYQQREGLHTKCPLLPQRGVCHESSGSEQEPFSHKKENWRVCVWTMDCQAVAWLAGSKSVQCPACNARIPSGVQQVLSAVVASVLWLIRGMKISTSWDRVAAGYHTTWSKSNQMTSLSKVSLPHCPTLMP